uniref:HD/PDEase domain-containing protein n=1 Tax=Ditylum brightwellii TaxID=49249 RepID=A0A7S2A3V8_9STRA|mmetsp:Transcript_7931/g.11834  ORF Transcript_7931/g.11834 Transcript_7931/m.11834 type:complete len:289 (+) Transcript_7931:123-989(+)
MSCQHEESMHLESISQSSTDHSLVVPQCPDDLFVVSQAVKRVKEFYAKHGEIKESHGWNHIQAVCDHTRKALLALDYTIQDNVVVEIQLAALLHDLDDKKYFPNTPPGEYPNASAILKEFGISPEGSRKNSYEKIILMISWVGCSENGNTVPKQVKDTDAYHLLIPRWADRLEAVGSRGVVRCYQYNQEKGLPISSPASPRPQNEEELWAKYATSDKLQEYMDRGGTSKDMISHYYDKLLHIARPPKDIVRNSYLEHQAESSSKDLVEVCLRYGKSGQVDKEYIMSLS